jgi:diadenosine tetraphosphate (Ap4A) HIT family hydrolase
MARINPDPHADRQVFALVNRVTGLADSEEQAMAMVRALEEGGVSTDDIDVFVGEQGARCLDLSGREHGRVVRLLRRLQSAVGDENAPNRRIEQGLARGGSLVCVKVDRRNVNEKPRAFRILEALHGHEIHYWGAWSFEDAQASAPCAFCQLPAERILGENEHAVWIFDAHPISRGHSLVIPKRHVESLFEATAAEREAILSLLGQAREHVKRDHAPLGYNISVNEGATANQTLLHLHVHLIPRYKVDIGHTRDSPPWVTSENAS